MTAGTRVSENVLDVISSSMTARRSSIGASASIQCQRNDMRGYFATPIDPPSFSALLTNGRPRVSHIPSRSPVTVSSPAPVHCIWSSIVEVRF